MLGGMSAWKEQAREGVEKTESESKRVLTWPKGCSPIVVYKATILKDRGHVQPLPPSGNLRTSFLIV